MLYLASLSLGADPATCPIVPGQETVIEISKGRSGLGLSIVGGKDTQLVWKTSALLLLTKETYGTHLKLGL